MRDLSYGKGQFQSYGLKSAIVVIAIGAVLAGCSSKKSSAEKQIPPYVGIPPTEQPFPAAEAPSFAVDILVLDEAEEPLAGAIVELPGATAITNQEGLARLEGLHGPVVSVVSAEGHLTEPVPLGWEAAEQIVTVKMLSDNGGSRLVMHFGGDVMFGRRYEDPENGDPLVPVYDPAGGAADVVSHLKRSFEVADIRSVNLETVLSDMSYDDAYPGKRFLLRSRAESVQGLSSLGVDMVSLGNNHARDWLDIGVADTCTALDNAMLPYVGGGPTADGATQPLIIEKKGLLIGNLAYTTVTGSFVNDNYPSDDVTQPADLSEEEAWLYEFREWEYEGAEWSATRDSRRIGGVWVLYSDKESELTDEARADVWASIVEVYPEMQDWVSRRGHGGAAWWTTSAATEQIAALAGSVDILVVQLHSGYQFQTNPSSTARKAARAAIEAGAHIVIAHHPHVLQGAEWYKGRLIFYSLGNFIFDQDFLATFSSGFVRAVWDRDQLVQARFIPVEIIGYRPTPVVDHAARRVLSKVWESSIAPATSDRDSTTGAVRPFYSETDADTAAAQMVFERNTARVVDSPSKLTVEMELVPGQVQLLDSTHLTPARLGLTSDATDDVFVGRDLFGWGKFDDEAADSVAAGDTHWDMDHVDEQIVMGSARPGNGFLRLNRDDKNESRVTTRPVARIPLAAHRLYREDPAGAVPLDPAASYSLLFAARLRGDALAEIRLDVYHFDDTNPTEDPESTRLAREEIPIEGLGTDWQTIQMTFDPAAYADDVEANMVMIYFLLSPPEDGDARLDIDDFALIEWRRAADMPEIHGAFTHAKTTGGSVRLNYDALTAAPQ